MPELDPNMLDQLRENVDSALLVWQATRAEADRKYAWQARLAFHCYKRSGILMGEEGSELVVKDLKRDFDLMDTAAYTAIMKMADNIDVAGVYPGGHIRDWMMKCADAVKDSATQRDFDV